MSIGEILKVGAIDTVLGMGTVFAILIFIAVCIWLMGKAVAPKKVAVAEAAPAAAIEPAETSQDGLAPEIVAAITAAILQQIREEQGEAAAEGYIVRNVRRAQWKHIS